MKIAYIGIKGLPSKGGAERVVEAITRRLSEKHNLSVYCSQHYTPPKAHIPGVRLIRLPCFKGKYTHMTSFDFLAAWHAVLWGNFDLIHVHNIEACFVLPILRLKYKVVSTAHGRHFTRPTSAPDQLPDKWGTVPKAIMKLMEIPYAELSNALTSVSEQNAVGLSERFHKPVRYIPNGVDAEPQVDIKAARAILEQYQIIEGSYIVFATGRMISSKGTHLLLEALNGIHADYRVLIIGGQATPSGYSQKLTILSNDRLTYVPFIDDRATLLGLLRLSRLFIFPSMHEAMSMMLLEAASIGAPILCSDIPGNTAVLPQQAVFFCSQDVEDLRGKLEWVMGHPEEMNLLGKKAQQHVQSNFSWDQIVRQYDQMYDETLGHG